MTTYDVGPGPDHQPVATASKAGKGRTFAMVGGLGAGLLVLGGGALAATMFFNQGEQPAEALPADTIAYASIDLDPSGGQKLEIINTLRKFPAFTEATDLDADSDIMKELFDEAMASGECGDLDYAADVEPWIGARAAFAVVDAGQEQPSPVAVVHATDSGKAEAGVDALIQACGGESDDLGVTLSGDWIVLAESQEITDTVARASEDGALADDEDFKRWTGEAGGEAIVSAYVSQRVADHADQLAELAESTSSTSVTSPEMAELGTALETDPASSEALRAALKDFKGAAIALRFNDGGLELEAAGGLPEQAEAVSVEAGAELVAGLPEETIAALGVGLSDGWLGQISKQLDESELADESLEEMLAEMDLTVQDVEQGLGEGIALALGGGLDVDAVVNGGPEDLPAGVVVKASADDVNALIGKVDDFGVSQGEESLLAAYPWLQAEGSDGVAVLSPHDGYRAALNAPDATLGESAEYESVVDDDAHGVFFVNFNADDNWLVRLSESEGNDEMVENAEPLAAFGVSWWVDGDVSHAKVRLTTD